MHFVDRMFLLWHSTEAMAAAMPAGMLHFTLLCFPLGVAIVRQHVRGPVPGGGAARADRAGRSGRGPGWGCIADAAVPGHDPPGARIFRLAGHAPDIGCLEVVYYQMLAFGAGGTLMSAAFATFFTGRGADPGGDGRRLLGRRA